jgi:drug/metabolite transporter (DMT)-like permease
MTWREFLMCLAFAFALPIGQAMFKWAAIYSARLEGPFALKLLQNWPLMIAFGWYALTAVFWFYILTRLPLANAYVFSMLGSGLVPLIAWLIFKEQLTWQFVVGFGLMLIGFVVVMQGRA